MHHCPDNPWQKSRGHSKMNMLKSYETQLTCWKNNAMYTCPCQQLIFGQADAPRLFPTCFPGRTVSTPCPPRGMRNQIHREISHAEPSKPQSRLKNRNCFFSKVPRFPRYKGNMLSSRTFNLRNQKGVMEFGVCVTRVAILTLCPLACAQDVLRKKVVQPQCQTQDYLGQKTWSIFNLLRECTNGQRRNLLSKVILSESSNYGAKKASTISPPKKH